MLRVEPELLTHYVADGRLSLVFHHVLDHGEASQVAHRGVECAGQQGPLSFWRMHDLLFAHQDEVWSGGEAVIVALAGELGLDQAAMQRCMADSTVTDKVIRMDQERRDAGIRLRPSFDLNGQLIQGGIPYEQFAQTIDGLLARP